MDKEYIVEVLDLELKRTTRKQWEKMRECYNNGLVGLKYGYTDYGEIVFSCSPDVFKSLEYYVGLEYERDNIELMIRSNNEVIVIYRNEEEEARATKLYDRLIEFEEEEKTEVC